MAQRKPESFYVLRETDMANIVPEDLPGPLRERALAWRAGGYDVECVLYQGVNTGTWVYAFYVPMAEVGGACLKDGSGLRDVTGVKSAGGAAMKYWNRGGNGEVA